MIELVPAAAPPDSSAFRSVSGSGTLLGHGRSELGRRLGAIGKRGYRQFALPDERGRRRVISEPHTWLKELQREAYDSILINIAVSDSSFSRPGRGAIANARQHLGRAYLTVLDVARCFPSTGSSAVFKALLDVGLDSYSAGALMRLTTLHGFLPEGAPTSPAILDIVFRPIDDALLALAGTYDATYTRYMDDLAFSGDIPLTRLVASVVRVLASYGYTSSETKRRVWGPHDRHTVTKIVVNTTLNATPEFLSDLTKFLRQLEHGNCGLSEEQICGKIRWVCSLNPKLGKTFERQHQAIARRRVAR